MSLTPNKICLTDAILALCGIAGPITYFIVLTTLGALWPGYNPIAQGMSELGATNSPYAIFMNVFGFQLLGVLTAAFGVGLIRSLGHGRAAKIGSALIILAGVDLIAAGFLPMDTGGITTSLIGLGHDITATIASNAMTLGMIALAFHFRKNPQWQRNWIFTLSLAIAAIALSPFPILPVYNPYAGLIQRLGMGLALLWIETISIRLLKLKNTLF